MKLGSDEQRRWLRKRLRRLKNDDEYFWIFATNCRAILHVSNRTRKVIARQLKEPKCNLSAFYNLRSRKLLSVNRMVKFLQYFQINDPNVLFGKYLNLAQARRCIRFSPRAGSSISSRNSVRKE